MTKINRNNFYAKPFSPGGKHFNTATFIADPMRRSNRQAAGVNQGTAALQLTFQQNNKRSSLEARINLTHKH